MEYIIAGAVVLVVAAAAIAFFLIKRQKNQGQRQGKAAERKVARALKRFASSHGGKVLSNVYLPLYDATTEVDHILVGPFGVLVVETKSGGGDIFGDDKQSDWTQVMGTKRHTMHSPLLQNKTHVDNLRHLFQKQRIYKVSVESLVVFTNPKVVLNVPRSLPVVRLAQLRKVLRRPPYTLDNGVDVNRICEVIAQGAVKGAHVKARHEAFVHSKQ